MNAPELPPCAHEACKVKWAYHWRNGMSAAFCIHGEQIPSLRGRTEEIKGRLEERIQAQGGGVEEYTDCTFGV